MIEDDYALLPAGAHEPEPKRCCELQDPTLFLAKNLFIWVATFAFIPLIAADQAGRISSLIYAVLLVALHVVFIVVYFWRVQFRSLDANRRSLAARVVGLLACVYLLYVVAGHLPERLGMLALMLVGLCVVHSFILALLSVRVRATTKPRPPVAADP